MLFNFINKDKLRLILKEVHGFILEHKKLKSDDTEPTSQDAKKSAVLERQHKQRIKQMLKQLHNADIAHIMESLPLEERAVVWQQIPRQQFGAILLELSEPVRSHLYSLMEEKDIVYAAKNLNSNKISDLAWLVHDLPEDTLNKIVKGLQPEQRAQLEEALSFPTGSVGSLMDFSMITINEQDSVRDALSLCRQLERLPDHSYQIHVVDENNTLKGYIPLQTLVTLDFDQKISDVMDINIVRFYPEDKALEAASAFERYDLISAPVINDDNKLIGRICVNDILEFISEYEEQQIRNQIGFSGKEDMFSGIWKNAQNRWLWLFINLFTVFLATRVISLFEGAIEQLVVLATLMPIVAATGGNIGNQACTLLVRALALGQITDNNVKQFYFKEVGISLINGLLWGMVMGFFVSYMYSNFAIGFVLMLAIAMNLTLAAAVGVSVPLIRYKMNMDPAMGSNVVVTFFADAFGFLIFLGLATMILI